jgi:hypothetical protein
MLWQTDKHQTDRFTPQPDNSLSDRKTVATHLQCSFSTFREKMAVNSFGMTSMAQHAGHPAGMFQDLQHSATLSQLELCIYLISTMA